MYGLGQEFIDVLATLHKLGLDSTDPVSVRVVQVAPRDVVAAALPNRAAIQQAGLNNVRRFTVEQMIEGYMHAYQHVIAASNYN